jgi:hypothetical protein
MLRDKHDQKNVKCASYSMGGKDGWMYHELEVIQHTIINKHIYIYTVTDNYC